MAFREMKRCCQVNPIMEKLKNLAEPSCSGLL